MAIIKKFRIKSFKKNNSLIEFQNVSLSYGKRLILDKVMIDLVKKNTKILMNDKNRNILVRSKL